MAARHRSRLQLMEGIFHEYYTVALAPAIGTLVGLGVGLAWQHRDHASAVALSILIALGSAVWIAYLLVSTVPAWIPLLPRSWSAAPYGGGRVDCAHVNRDMSLQRIACAGAIGVVFLRRPSPRSRLPPSRTRGRSPRRFRRHRPVAVDLAEPSSEDSPELAGSSAVANFGGGPFGGGGGGFGGPGGAFGGPGGGLGGLLTPAGRQCPRRCPPGRCGRLPLDRRDHGLE